MQFTKQQCAAIDHKRGNLQLIACAGSGKTEVIARRIVTLLRPCQNSSVLPRNIIAFTFTEKAAAELKERIHDRCREELGEITGLAEMYVGTIHGWCLDLLKAEVPKYSKFEVLNEVQQTLFIDRHSSKCGLTSSTDLNGQQLRRWQDTRLYVSAISILREAAMNKRALKDCTVPVGMEAYRALLDESGYLDYSGILAEADCVLRKD